jgi:RND superfamily putative drug exporter
VSVPILLFCFTFGLSLDYEIFMLGRVREAWASDPETAVARGLAATARPVMLAALIMALVFGAFVGVELALVKVLGFGLAVAIVLDATVIRGVLAPALLAIAGRWNWWPGLPPGESKQP